MKLTRFAPLSALILWYTNFICQVNDLLRINLLSYWYKCWNWCQLDSYFPTIVKCINDNMDLCRFCIRIQNTRFCIGIQNITEYTFLLGELNNEPFLHHPMLLSFQLCRFLWFRNNFGKWSGAFKSPKLTLQAHKTYVIIWWKISITNFPRQTNPISVTLIHIISKSHNLFTISSKCCFSGLFLEETWFTLTWNKWSNLPAFRGQKHPSKQLLYDNRLGPPRIVCPPIARGLCDYGDIWKFPYGPLSKWLL